MTTLPIKNRNIAQREFQRFARFLVVGMSGTLLDLAILSLLKVVFGWATLPANLISYSCGIINNYFLNRYWVYPESRHRQGWRQVVQFVVISLVGLGLNNLIVLALESLGRSFLANPSLAYLPAKIVATLVVLLWNFFANRLWTFSQS